MTDPAVRCCSPDEVDPPDLAAQLGRPERWPTSWDPSLSRADHALLRAHTLLRSGDDARLCMSSGAAEAASVGRLAPLTWDTDHFGVAMGVLDLAPHGSPESTARVVRACLQHARALELRHLRCSLDVGDHASRRVLQDAGFRAEWVYARIVCDTARVPAFTAPNGVEIVPTAVAHLPALEEAAGRLPPYSWLEHDPDIPRDRRTSYVRTRLANCVRAGLADLCQTLLVRGRPLGFNASRLHTHHPSIASPTTYSWELDTFVDPQAPPGLGATFERGVIATLRAHARFVHGRVRLDGVAMFRATERAGFRTDGGEIVWVRRERPGL